MISWFLLPVGFPQSWKVLNFTAPGKLVWSWKVLENEDTGSLMNLLGI